MDLTRPLGGHEQIKPELVAFPSDLNRVARHGGFEVVRRLLRANIVRFVGYYQDGSASVTVTSKVGEYGHGDGGLHYRRGESFWPLR